MQAPFPHASGMIRRMTPYTAVFRGLIATVLLLPGLLAAAPVIVDADRHSYQLGPVMEMFEDTSATLTAEQVASGEHDDRFVPVGRERANFGFRASALWFRIQVDFRSARDSQWHLVELHPIIDDLTFFLPAGFDRWEAIPMGDTLPWGARIYDQREFIAPLPRSLINGPQPVTFYVRVAGKGALNVDLRLEDAQGLVERSNKSTWGYGLFYGALLMMFVYNLVLWLSVRDRAQRDYMVFLAGFVMLFLALDGFGLQFLWPEMPAINGWFPVFTCIAMIGAVQFTRSFLDVQAGSPRLDNVFRWMLHAVVAVFFLGMLLPRHWAYVLGTVLPIFFAFTMLGAGIMRLRQGYRPARLFVLGWGFFLLGSVLLPLANLGLIPANTLTLSSPQIGTLWQVVVLSLALGERMKLLRQENERIQRESHARLQEMFGELERLDTDKLRFLHYLSHELNTPLNWMGATRLVEGGQLNGPLRDMVGAVEKGQQRMIDLVSTVLRYFELAREDITRVPSAPVAPMWLVDAILKERAADIAAKGLAVRNRVPADLVLLGNDRRLQRVLEILVDNALHYSSEDGEVEISGRIEQFGDEPPRGVIEVHDQGRGIDVDHLERLFEPFFMVGSHHREDGFGLNLAISRLLMRSMQGDIRAHSEGRGTGATVSFSLPLVESASPVRPARDEIPPQPAPAT